MNSQHRFSRRHHRPDWWPENEEWPPRPRHWRGGRAPFFRRLGCLFAAFYLLGLVLMLTMVGFFLNLFGLVHFSSDLLRGLLPLGGFFFVCLVVMIILAARNLHHLSAPLDDLLDLQPGGRFGLFGARRRERTA